MPRLLLILLLLCAALPAYAAVRRCTAADGSTVFTDRRCADIGATERVPRSAVPPLPLHRDSCPRNLRDLVYAITTAIDSGDPNRLAGVYLWSGMSTRGGYAVMDRLQRIVDRPLVDVTPVYPGNGPTDGDYYPQTTVRRVPIALRLEQTLANGSTPSRTVLGLHRALGCWWVSL